MLGPGAEGRRGARRKVFSASQQQQVYIFPKHPQFDPHTFSAAQRTTQETMIKGFGRLKEDAA